MRTMNLYHRKYTSDKDAIVAFNETKEAIEKAEGVSWPAVADGAGPAFHVLVLPEGTTPESLGITDAYLVTTFQEDNEPDEDDIPLEDEETEEDFEDDDDGEE